VAVQDTQPTADGERARPIAPVAVMLLLVVATTVGTVLLVTSAAWFNLPPF